MSMEGQPPAPEKRELRIDEALAQILMMEQAEQQKGAFDSEKDAFTDIRNRLMKGEITPAEAMRQAQAIGESRYDYH